MLKLQGIVLSVVLAAGAGFAWAHCGNCEKKASQATAADKASSCKTACAKGECKQESCAGCPIQAAMARLPRMTYLIGEKKTCCEKSAAKLAEKSDSPVRFVVANTTYEDKSKAMLALADATEAFVNRFTTVSTCKVSGTAKVAGQELHCKKTAARLASIAKQAVDGVAMSYQVGDKQCHCPREAKSLAKKSGKKTEYRIGDKTTCCPIDARIKLARAKYLAAVQALAESKEKVGQESADKAKEASKLTATSS